TGNYLTIEPKPGYRVPVVVWKISDSDERCLDIYEGCPRFYYKTTMEVTVHSLLDGKPIGAVEALIYIMHEDRELGCPTGRYFDACLEGYQRFGFDPRCLGRALTDSVDRKTAKRFLEQS
ncbi:MAG: gamma-glutamylcyclotransferase, partial [Butyricicoccus sp.]|nr:gamma-glutamylcyclotransferase [Butyricicoccus sp.]MDY4087624.1 gamma-glutamylcyclotransferase family protein [Butyricicoccus intestinisimiae]